MAKIKYINKDELDYEDIGFDEEIAEKFAKDISDILYSIVDIDDTLDENFVSPKCRDDHFKKHCLGNSTGKVSKITKVYYDFTDKSQYLAYEKQVTSLINDSEYHIGSLYDYDEVIWHLKKLFEGSTTVTFTNSCGFTGPNGIINLSLHAFSSDVTKNYLAANTIDVCVKNQRNRTITLYPVDAHYLQTKFNNIIKKYSR